VLLIKKLVYICKVNKAQNKKQNIMKAINPTLISDNNTFKFKSFKSAHVDQIDVFHKGNRVAILNGIDGAALRWVANSEKINIKAVIQLEKMVERLVKQSIKIYLKNK